MKIIATTRILVLACFLCCSFRTVAQYTQDTRAKNWLTLQVLKMKREAAPWALSAEELKELRTLDGAPTISACAYAQTSFCPAAALPVTGLELHGQRISTVKVKLEWETKAEYNCRGFVLERQSIYSASVYDSLAFVQGVGTSHVKSKYTYTDMNDYRASSFYRIRQVDIDQRSTYSNIAAIEGYDGKLNVMVVPNPATGSNLRFYFQAPYQDQIISFGIFNATGIQVLRRNNFPAADGYYEILNHQLPPGYYCITVYTKNGTCTKPFTILR